MNKLLDSNLSNQEFVTLRNGGKNEKDHSIIFVNCNADGIVMRLRCRRAGIDGGRKKHHCNLA